MATLQSTQFDRFAFPLPTPPLCNSNALWPSEPMHSIRSLNAAGIKKVNGTVLASSQIKANGITAVTAEAHERALADNGHNSDDDFPPLEELYRATLPQPQILPQSPKPLQDQIGLQGVHDITKSTPVESALYSLPQSSSSGDYGWTNETIAKLEKELGLALGEQQVESSSASTTASQSLRLAKAPQEDIQSRQQSETTGRRPEELQDTSRRETPALELWEKPDLAEIIDTDDLKDREATKALLAAQSKIPKTKEHFFRLRGIRVRQLVSRQTKTTQYRVVWGDPPNSSVLVAELKGSTPLPICDAQCEILGYPSTPTRDENDHASQASRSLLPLANPALQGKPTIPIQGYPDAHSEISTDTHRSANMDDNNDSCDTSDEDVRPTKRRRRHSVSAVASPHRQHSPTITTSIEAGDAQPQLEHECLSAVLDKKQHHDSRHSRSSSKVIEALPAAEYQEWPFQGFLKCTRVGKETTYNLEFRLPFTYDHPHFPTDSLEVAFCSRENARPRPLYRTSHSPFVYSKTRSAKAKLPTTRNLWTKQEDRIVVQMKADGCSWEDIRDALPHRSMGSIQVRYSTKLKCAAGHCTVCAKSEATMYPPAYCRNHPSDHLPMARSAVDEHELVRTALNSDIFEEEERQRQKEGEQDDREYGQDHINEDGRQLQQEVKEDVTATLTSEKVGDIHLSSKDESLRLAIQHLFPELSQDNGNTSFNNPIYKKRKRHLKQRSKPKYRPHAKLPVVRDGRDGRGICFSQLAQLIESVGHVGRINDFTIKTIEQHSFLLTGFSRHTSSTLSSGTILSPTIEANCVLVNTPSTTLQHSRAVGARALLAGESKASSSDNESSLSDSDPDLSSDDNACSNEQRLLAYKKEDKSWGWIFKKFPGRTQAVVRTR
ncbi:hypothetical protein D0Z07_9333 [Hyphodiscus hymeniophilus]|uniref:Myb-like domain-containing protein n=1 Tax=Hyphodiscus hymeniophilus TaxID=353542 RepID=A0A9P6VC45_9HELO|nr:hypothetical protein D0Z07_9333 [Hyphodiscus hymeniophilus]